LVFVQKHYLTFDASCPGKACFSRLPRFFIAVRQGGVIFILRLVLHRFCLVFAPSMGRLPFFPSLENSRTYALLPANELIQLGRCVMHFAAK
jgi:hypothetical protein